MQKKKWKNVWILTGCIMAFLVGGLTVHAETGATGYPKIMKVPGLSGEDTYLTVENAAEWLQRDTTKKGIGSPTMPVEPKGFYELDGHVVYLEWGDVAKMEIVEGFFADENGYLQPYTAQTKAAVDAHINASLANVKAQATTMYGVNFSFRKGHDNCSNYQFVQRVMNNFQEYPAGCVPVIANATKAKTGKNLTFRQRFAQDEWVLMDGSTTMGIYSYETNLVQTDCDPETTAHEMGHGMQPILNSVSGGALQATFSQLNSGVQYSKYYYYDGNEELRNNVPDCFVTGYSATSFAEDFADTFAQALLYNNAELQEELQKGYCSGALYQKIMYVKQLFNQYAGAEILN